MADDTKNSSKLEDKYISMGVLGDILHTVKKYSDERDALLSDKITEAGNIESLTPEELDNLLSD